MTRKEKLDCIAVETTILIRKFGSRDDILVTFHCPTKQSISEMNEWDRERFIIHAGGEYFFVYEMTPKGTRDNHLLYVVNVTGDSVLTAASELMHLVSGKF